MTPERPILIAGFGSIGRRHLRNLKALGHKNFVLYRTGKSTLPDDEIKDIPTEYDLDKALAYKPVATIIANPTALHMPVALAAAKVGSHLFLEKPVSHSMEGVEDLRRFVHKNNLIVMVGFQFRFHPFLRKIKQLLEKNRIGQVVNVQAHWGEYLPDWHTWEDYHQSYSAKAKLGGGVLLTLSHPFDYLRYLLGEVESVSAVQSQSGGLGIDVEDNADVLLHFKSGVIGNVHLDYIQHPSEHFIRIIGQKGEIYKRLDSDDFDRNEMFLDEMRHLLSCINKNEQPLCTIKDGIAALQIVLAAKQSASAKRLIKL